MNIPLNKIEREKREREREIYRENIKKIYTQTYPIRVVYLPDGERNIIDIFHNYHRDELIKCCKQSNS